MPQAHCRLGIFIIIVIVVIIILILRAQIAPSSGGKFSPRTLVGNPFAIPPFPRSPNWHRKQRRQRSQTRKALKRGLTPSCNRLRDLYLHHATSAPFRQAIGRMGKQNRQWGSGQAYASYSQATYPQEARWQLWEGAWSPSQRWEKESKKGSGRLPSLLTTIALGHNSWRERRELLGIAQCQWAHTILAKTRL